MNATGFEITRICYSEQLSDGRTVWVCQDPRIVGIVAQGDTEEEATASFEECMDFYIKHIESMGMTLDDVLGKKD